jgi:predicted GIY-YIG superfamily endonuclease
MKREFIVYVRMTASHRVSTGVSVNMKAIIPNGASSNGFGYRSGRKAHSSSKIVYYEIKRNKRVAISREKELNKLNRKKLRELIRSNNPELLDLSTTWIEDNTYFSENALFLV